MLEEKAVIWSSQLSRSTVDFQALEQVAHVFSKVAEVVGVVVVLIIVVPTPCLQLGLHVAIPGAL